MEDLSFILGWVPSAAGRSVSVSTSFLFSGIGDDGAVEGPAVDEESVVTPRSGEGFESRVEFRQDLRVWFTALSTRARTDCGLTKFDMLCRTLERRVCFDGCTFVGAGGSRRVLELAWASGKETWRLSAEAAGLEEAGLRFRELLCPMFVLERCME